MLERVLPLAVITAGCAGLLALTQQLTEPRIERNLRDHELRLVTELAGTLPPTSTGWSGDVWNLCNNTLSIHTSEIESRAYIYWNQRIRV